MLIAPPDYHMLVEPGTVALSCDEPVAFSRPSIDVLFESAAEAYRDGVLGVILTGASADGTAGAQHIKRRGGTALGIFFHGHAAQLQITRQFKQQQPIAVFVHIHSERRINVHLSRGRDARSRAGR